MVEFYISAISHFNGHISSVLVHTGVAGNRLSKGLVVDKSTVIQRINQGQTFKTVTYNYTQGEWRAGAKVTVVNIGGNLFLRTMPDSTLRDNLGNLLLIDEIR